MEMGCYLVKSLLTVDGENNITMYMFMHWGKATSDRAQSAK